MSKSQEMGLLLFIVPIYGIAEINMKITIIVNTLKYNRGTEAIVRGVEGVIHAIYSDAEITVVANDNVDTVQSIMGIKQYIKKNDFGKKNLIKCIQYIVLRDIFKKKICAAKLRYSHVLKNCKEADVVLCVGADNFDKHYGMINNLREFHDLLRVECDYNKLVLFDCSIGENDFTQEVIEECKKFYRISVRESITLKSIKDYCKKSDIYFHLDPAFLMEPEITQLPAEWVPKRMVGVNISGLILMTQYGGDTLVLLKAYEKLIRRILSDGYFPILIPHVMDGSDAKAIELLKEQCNDIKIPVLNSSYNARQIKYVISKCSMFIGARTHATIAAYSSCIPTLVIGYSVKSIGIARDLFESTDRYVVPIDKIKTSNELVDSFEWLESQKENIHRQLVAVMDHRKKQTQDELAKMIQEIIPDGAN